jgi:tetraacyldisaccharide 4'-kinase
MSVFSQLYGSVIAARNHAFDRGWKRVNRLKHPVVSVGNLSVGGSGKTPFLLMLGKLLQERGVAFDILSRGYGRSDSRIRLVDEKGSAELYGDEPLLLAQNLHVPVIVGPDRYKAGVYAEHMFSEVKPAHGLWLHLLDDGFQHRQLARDFDIVIVRPEDVKEELLPAGYLREPVASLKRADAIVLTEGATVEGLPIDKQHVWRVTRRIELDTIQTDFPKKPFILCSIARPERFVNDLRSKGVDPVGQALYPDHYQFSESDIRMVCEKIGMLRSDVILTTEKDAMRLAPYRAQLEKVARIITVPLVMELVDPKQAVDVILGTVAERLRCQTAD